MAQKEVRNYQQEYQRRIARAKARGLSRSQARGHARAHEKPVRTRPIQKNIEAEMEAVRKALSSGSSLTQAAKLHGVSTERARRYIAAHGIAKFEGGRWQITDARPRQVPIASNGEQKVVVVSPAEASKAARYANAAKNFLNTNDPEFLVPFEGATVKDIRGRKHKLETDPNALHRIAAADDHAFHEVYAVVV